jgi:tight adherence protein B
MIELGDAFPLVSSALAFLAALLAALWIGPVWDAVARFWVRDLAALMPALDLDEAWVTKFLRGWGMAMIGVVAVVGVLLRMPLLVPLLLLVVFLMPRWVLRGMIRRRRLLLRDQLVNATLALANTTRAGQSLPQGLEAISETLPPPLAGYLQRVVRDYRRGRTLTDAIQDAKARLDLDSFTMFATAIVTCLERGGRVTESLDGISRTLVETQRLERKIESDTASGRMLQRVLVAFPFLFVIGFYFIDRASTSLLFTTLIGQAVLDVVGLLILVSILWANRLLTIDI